MEGAWSEQATHTYFGEDADVFGVESFRDAMRAIDLGEADYAVLPIENSSAGIVSANFDLLAQFDNYIVAEQVIQIEHCLLGLPGAEESQIKTVCSHTQALMQCEDYIEDRGFTTIPFANTAMAARKIKSDGDISAAAIAGKRSAELYGLTVLKENINSSRHNSTRFIIVTGQKIFRRDAGKISISFEIPDKRGSLYHILSHFIYNDLNMSRIESRPIPDRPWEYRFFIDFDGNFSDAGAGNAISALRDETRNMKILGNY